jgi:hypothetical protein
MANTTNFGWETPDDTDLVKDGAAAIRTLGSAIDTSLVDLKGGTTGQVLAKASNTDMDFTWATDASGIPATIFDAKGDIIAASAADTAARLAVGANNTVLTADSSTATGLKWAAPAGGGKVLQVVQVETNSQTTVSSTTFTDTSLSATITPTLATSKILVLISQSVYAAQALNTGSQNFNRAIVKLLRGATDIRDFGYVKTFASPAITGLDMHGGGTVFLQYLDSPATTSAITYKTQGKSGTTTGSAFVQFQISLTGGDIGYSAMTLLEIGA